MRRSVLPLALVGVSLAFTGAVRSAAAQDVGADSVPLATRLWIGAKMLSAVRTYFAHWEGVPDLDLDRAFQEYAAEAAVAPDRRSFSLASMAFLARLRNGHTGFFDNWLKGSEGASPGFSLRREADGGWIVVESRHPGIEPGDQVTDIDGRPVGDVVADMLPYISASSDREARRRVWYSGLLWPERFTLLMADGRRVDVHRGVDELRPVTARRFETRQLEGGVAYVRIPSFGSPAMEDSTLAFLERRAEAPAIVVDVRRNGGGTTPTRLIEGLMDRPYRGFGESTSFDIGLYSAYRRINEIVSPGALDDFSRGYVGAFAGFDRPRLVFPGEVQQPGTPVYAGPLLILVDAGCASACEDFVLPLETSGRATLVGEATQGSTGQPFLWDFGNGMSFRVSAKRVLMPDGSRFEGVGIEPDVEVVPTADELRRAEDPVLRRALEIAARKIRRGR